MRKAIPLVSIILLTVVIALAGCGAGGSSSTNGTTSPVTENPSPTPEPPVVTKKVSGVAAAGAPMIGRAYLKDSSNPAIILGPTEIAADGSFSFDVTNLTAPFYLQAEGTVGGQGYKLHSVAMSDGTANINPLTDLAVAAAAGVNDPAEVYNNPSANSINSAALDKAIADIQAMLQPLLDAYSVNTNFLSDAYTADHTGLDGVLDVVEVSINTSNGEVLINDKITNDQIGSTTTISVSNSTDAISNSEATQSVGVSTDLQGIAALLSNFATTLNKGVSLQEEDLDPYFANNFGMDDGLDRALMIDDWRGNASGCDNCISSISGVAIKEKKDNGDYVIATVFYTSDGSVYPGVEFTVTREDNAWRFKGNGYKSSIDIYPITEKYFDSNGKESSVVSGIRFDVEDNGNNGLHYIIITGPGLPEEGIEMAKGTPDVVDMEPVNWGQGDFYHVYPMSDTTIGTLDEINLTYTVVVYDTQGELVETRTRTLPKRPYKVSEVDASYFLQISGIPDHNTNSLHLDGGTLSFNYNSPTVYQIGEMNMEVGYWGSGGWETTEKGLSPNDTSASIVTLGLPDGFILGGGWLRSDVYDMYGRDISVSWQFSSTSTALFQAYPEVKFSISGVVTSGGVGLSGVTVTLSRADYGGLTTTDSNGNYSFDNLQNGNYTVTPGKSGYTFNPVNVDVTVNGADVTRDFTATAVVVPPVTGVGSISGDISYSGAQTGMIIVGAWLSPLNCSQPNQDGYTYTEVSALGNYTLSGLPDGAYYVASVIIPGSDLQPADPWGIYGGCDTSIPVRISGGNDVSGIDITLIDGSETLPNPFYEEYNVDIHSEHFGDYKTGVGYAPWAYIRVEDPAYKAFSVTVAGYLPSAGGEISLVYDEAEGEWAPEDGTNTFLDYPLPPLPLTYTVTITDPSGMIVKTDAIEAYVDVYATNLSATIGEVEGDPVVFSWTGGSGLYQYCVTVIDDAGTWLLDTCDITSTTFTYDGPPLTPGKTYQYWVWVEDMNGNSAVSSESFVYSPSSGDTSNPPPAENQAIVGTWYGGSTAERPLYIFTFFANGTYMLADDDDSTTNTDPNNPICQPGIEHGIYTWDPATGAFWANPTITDTNGECGFTTDEGLGSTAIVTISGNTLTMDMGDHGGSHQVTRLLPDADYPIVGTWYGGTPGQADNLVVLTFFTDSTYVQAQDGVVEPGIAQDGIELGTYTWNQETAAFITSVPLADTIGEWGFNNVLSEDGVTVTINDDTLTITVPGEGIYTGTRLVP